MILAAALLVLLGLGLFVGGILTGTTVLYWLCVAACAAAGVFLLLARIGMGRAAATPATPAPRGPAGAQHLPAATTGGAATTGATAASAVPTAVPTAGSPSLARADERPPAEAPAGAAVAPPPAAPTWERTAARAWETTAAPVGDPAAPPASDSPQDRPVVAAPSAYEPVGPPSTAAHAPRGRSGVQDAAGNPPVEEVEVTDLLVVVDLHDEVLVVDEHPRYHLGGCRWLAGRETIPLPLDEARTDGFTPCAWCEPDRTLAERERARRTGRG